MAHDSVEDLIALARRGLLSAPESRRLEIALRTSPAALSLYEVGTSFDAMRTQQTGDAELLAAVANRVSRQVAEEGLSHGRPKASKKRYWGAVAVALVGTAAAATGVLAFRESGRTQATPQAVATTSQQRGAAAQAASSRTEANAPSRTSAGRNAEAALVNEEDLKAVDADDPTSPPAVSARGATSAKQRQSPARRTAQDLFKAGNIARKAGQHTRALTTYQKLQQTFPSSPEAQLSRVLSGRMLLSMGRASHALSHFESYLDSGGRGGLAEEALWGKAQALSQLGRGSEARAAWRKLLQQYPKSVYAPNARLKLER